MRNGRKKGRLTWAPGLLWGGRKNNLDPYLSGGAREGRAQAR